MATITISFSQCRFVHLPRKDNQVIDALATLASIWQDGKQTVAKPLILARSKTPYYKAIRVISVELSEKLWFYDLQRYLEMG